MKKLLAFFVAIFALFLLVGCGEEKQKQLSTPTNVAVSESGLVTWDVVTNATSYAVKVNEESFMVETNQYQVKDLSKDFTVTVKALADGFISSLESAAVKFESKDDEIKEAMAQELVPALLGSKEEAVDKEKYDRQAKVITDGCIKSFNYGVDVKLVKDYVKVLEELDDIDIQMLLFTLVDFVKDLNEDKIVGLTVFTTYYFETLLEDLTGFEDFTEEDYALLKQLCEMIVRNEAELGVALGNIIAKGVKIYKKFTLEVMPLLMNLSSSALKAPTPQQIAMIKNTIVRILQANLFTKEEIAVVLTFVQDGFDLIVSSLPEEEEGLAAAFNQIFDTLNTIIGQIETEKLAGLLVDTYVEILDLVESITVELIAEAMNYQNPKQIIAYLALHAVKNNTPEVEIKNEDVLFVVNAVYEIVKANYQEMPENLYELMGIDVAAFNELVAVVVAVLNSSVDLSFDFISVDANIKLIVDALAFTQEEYSDYVIFESTDPANDEYLQMVLEEYLLTSVSELEIGDYYITNITNEEGVIAVTEINVYIFNMYNDVIEYSVDEYVTVITNVEAVMPLVKEAVNYLETKEDVILPNLVKVLNLVNSFLADESLEKTIINCFINATDEDLKAAYKDVIALIKAFVSYVDEIGAEEYVLATLSGESTMLSDLITDENIALVKKLVSDIANILEKGEAFPIVIPNGEEEITIANKEELLQMLDEYLAMLTTEAPLVA